MPSTLEEELLSQVRLGDAPPVESRAHDAADGKQRYGRRCNHATPTTRPHAGAAAGGLGAG